MNIPLSIAGLLSLAVILYAANPSPCATVNTPVGVAASTTDLIVTEYCGHNVDTIDCQGNVTLLATLPGITDALGRILSPLPGLIGLETPGLISIAPLALRTAT